MKNAHIVHAQESPPNLYISSLMFCPTFETALVQFSHHHYYLCRLKWKQPHLVWPEFSQLCPKFDPKYNKVYFDIWFFKTFWHNLGLFPNYFPNVTKKLKITKKALVTQSIHRSKIKKALFPSVAFFSSPDQQPLRSPINHISLDSLNGAYI